MYGNIVGTFAWRVNIPVKRVMLVYPPGALFQRGEDRCQSNVESSTATSMRACNDLGYISSQLKKDNHEIFLKDYPSENLTIDDFLNDFRTFLPDVLFISTTNATIFDDLEIIKQIKKQKRDTVVILKGAVFFDAPIDLINNLVFEDADYLVGGESEFIVRELVNYHFYNPENINNVPAIFYKKDNIWHKTFFDSFDENVDSLPFPDRSLMNNSLYVRPDTGEMQATISIGRGCPSSCIYCLSPKINGKKVRQRTPKNVLDEMIDCYQNFGIKNFFFKSDTFTINEKWVIELCDLILNSELAGKINWVANSRTNTVSEAMFKKMKKAGCWLVAFGFESGSQDSLNKMKKGTTVEQSYEAVKIAKKAGLKIFGFYMIGFPWETESHLEQTKKLMFKLDTDFVEVHIATPFYGTEFYEMLKNDFGLSNDVLGKDYFKNVIVENSNLSSDFILKYRSSLLLQYHLRPRYILNKLIEALLNPKILFNYSKYGFRLIRNLSK